MTPAISVIVPTRGRIRQLDRMLTSLWRTAGDPTCVEVILRMDLDDLETYEPLAPDARVHIVVGERLNGYATLATLTNEAARAAAAPLILVVNDDVEFQTPAWDLALQAAAAAYPDGIFNLGVTTMNAGKFVFPCVSRRQIDVLGCLFDERLVYTDIWLRDVVKPFGRAIRVPEVRIEHHWEGKTDDQTNAAAKVQTPEYQQLYALCVAEGQAKIRKVWR